MSPEKGDGRPVVDALTDTRVSPVIDVSMSYARLRRLDQKVRIYAAPPFPSRPQTRGRQDAGDTDGPADGRVDVLPPPIWVVPQTCPPYLPLSRTVITSLVTFSTVITWPRSIKSTILSKCKNTTSHLLPSKPKDFSESRTDKF